MSIMLWPDRNIYLSTGITGIFQGCEVPPDLIFIDCSVWNIREILTGKFLFSLAENATFVFICDKRMLPLAQYYCKIVSKSSLYQKNTDPTDFLRDLRNRRFHKKQGKTVALNRDEFILLRLMLINKLSIANIAWRTGVSVNTVYTRGQVISRKMGEKKLDRLMLY